MHWAITKVEGLLEEVKEERDDLAAEIEHLDRADVDRLDGKVEGVEMALAALRDVVESEIDSMAVADGYVDAE